MDELEYQCRNWYHFSWLSGDDAHAVARAQPRQGIVGDARGAAGESARDRGPLGVVRADLRRHGRLTIRSSTNTRTTHGSMRFGHPDTGAVLTAHFRLRVWHQGSRVAAELFHSQREELGFFGQAAESLQARASEFFAGIRSGKLINSAPTCQQHPWSRSSAKSSATPAGSSAGKRRDRRTSRFHRPARVDFNIEPPIKPGPDGASIRSRFPAIRSSSPAREPRPVPHELGFHTDAPFNSS